VFNADDVVTKPIRSFAFRQSNIPNTATVELPEQESTSYYSEIVYECSEVHYSDIKEVEGRRNISMVFLTKSAIAHSVCQYIVWNTCSSIVGQQIRYKFMFVQITPARNTLSYSYIRKVLVIRFSHSV